MSLQPDVKRVDETTWYFTIDPPVFVAEPYGNSYRRLNEVRVERTIYSDTEEVTWRASCRGLTVTSKDNKRGGQAASYSREAHEFEAQALAAVKNGLPGVPLG